jgi:hypothetical protein
MTLSEIYRAKAAVLADQAKSATAQIYKQRFAKMALAYERLAEKYANRLRLYEKKAQAPRGHQRRGRKSKNPKAPAATRAEASKTSA